MGTYHTTYNVKSLDMDQRRRLIDYAKSICYHWHVDVILPDECRRMRLDMEYDRVMSRFNDKCLLVVTHRGAHYELDDPMNYLEVCFTTMGGYPEYFLWIYINPKFIDQFVQDNGLVV